MLHLILLLSVSCALSYHVARTYPSVYLRWQDTIAWGTHALSLGLLFGMGVIVGRYGLSQGAIGLVADWLIVYAPVVTCVYVAMLLYHDHLCSLAANRRDDAKESTLPGSTAAIGLRARC